MVSSWKKLPVIGVVAVKDGVVAHPFRGNLAAVIRKHRTQSGIGAVKAGVEIFIIVGGLHHCIVNHRVGDGNAAHKIPGLAA